MKGTYLSWQQRASLWLRLGIRILILIAVILFFRQYGRTVLKTTMPFLLGWVSAVLLNPLVAWIEKRTGRSRKQIALFAIVGILSLVGAGVFLLIYYAGRELVDLLANWDLLFDGIQSAMDSIDTMFARFFSVIPPELTAMADAALAWSLEWIQESIPQAVKSFGMRTTDKFKGLPSFLIAFVFFLMGAYFMTADYPTFCRCASKGMSARLRRGLEQTRSTAVIAFGGYLKAQLILSFGVFCILLLGFLITGQSYALLLAFALAVLDFIPLLGAGTAMVPWAIIALLSHRHHTAIAVAVIWGIITIYRRIAEPKIVGEQTGLSPVLSLFSIYAGMKLGGILGMILGPALMLITINLCRSGIFRGAWYDIRAAVMDVAAILNQHIED